MTQHGTATDGQTDGQTGQQGQQGQQGQPTHQQVQQATQQATQRASDGFSDVTPKQMFDAINALPERIADSVKEMFPAPSAQSTQQSGSESGNSNQQQSTKSEPGSPSGNSASEKFANWWFGK